MSVMGFLGRSIRLQRNCVVTRSVQQRALTGVEAANALRPFYFAVHPDFFGQHPREREVNENSLKRFNGYLEKLEQPGSPSPPPTQLTFYVREMPPLPHGFRSVSFTLRTTDVLSTVVDVLTSCHLPVEHMAAGAGGRRRPRQPPGRPPPSDRPIRWHKSYYSFTGFKDPEEEAPQVRSVQPTLSAWLSANEAKATLQHSASLPRRDELRRLKEELCSRLRLLDIRWQRSWGVTHKHCQLQSLSRLSQQSPEALGHLQGHTVVFGDQSEMNTSGHVTLGTTDVHHQWLKLFLQLPHLTALHLQSEQLKERLSFLLGGAQVVHLGPPHAIQEHYSTLSAFHHRLQEPHLRLHPRSLLGLSVSVTRDRCSPSLHPMGHFIVPAHCEPSALQRELQGRANEARLRTQRNLELQAEEAAAVRLCEQRLSLRSLTKDCSVSSEQMLRCCLRLTELRQPLLQGLHVHVSHFYSVLQDGDVCVPWDWKSL